MYLVCIDSGADYSIILKHIVELTFHSAFFNVIRNVKAKINRSNLHLHLLLFSKYPRYQAVIPPEIPRGDGCSTKESISCGDETKQTSHVPIA